MTNKTLKTFLVLILKANFIHLSCVLQLRQYLNVKPALRLADLLFHLIYSELRISGTSSINMVYRGFSN